MMKTIAYFSNLFPPVATGSATQSFGLAREMAAQGHRVIVITPHLDKKTPKVEEINGFKVYRIPCLHLPKMQIALNFPWLNSTFSISNIFRIRNILETEKVDLVHVHNHMFDLALMGSLVKIWLGIPFVVTIHTMIKHANPLFNAILFPLDRFFLKFFVISRADGIVSPDVNMDRYMRERFDRQDSKIIPYGISLPTYPGEQIEKEIVQKFNLKDKRVILSLGHLHSLRNRMDLIKGLALIKDQFPDLKLVIVGGVMDQRPVQLVKELGLQNHVVFTGPQPHSVVPVFHKLAEIEAMWLDQDKNDLNSLGIACMEGMLAGKPVMAVANERTFGPGVLKNGQNVIILKSGNPQYVAEKITELFTDTAKGQAIGQSAQQIATKYFAWNGVADQHENLYSNIIARYVAVRQDKKVLERA